MCDKRHTPEKYYIEALFTAQHAIAEISGPFLKRIMGRFDAIVLPHDIVEASIFTDYLQRITSCAYIKEKREHEGSCETNEVWHDGTEYPRL